jgi:hypothetical protein
MTTLRVELSENVYTLLTTGDNFIQNQSSNSIRVVHAASEPSANSVDFITLTSLQGFTTVNGLPAGNTYARSGQGTTFVTVDI